MRFTLTGPESDAAAAWALVGDTDHLNRLADNPRMEMRLAPDETGFPEVTGALVGPGPLRHTYREVDSRWVTGRWFDQERVIRGPLMRRTHYRARLEPGAAGGVVPTIELDVEFGNALTGAVGGAVTKGAMKRWQLALDALPEPGAAVEVAPSRVLPGAVEAAFELWTRRDVDAGIIERVGGWMRSARVADLRQIRPFALADEWGLERRAVVQAFLEGAQVGAVEMFWATRCPRCGAGLNRADVLSDLADHADCPSCRIGFANELDRNVEVLFAAHPAIRPPAEERFCTMYPKGRPEVLALATVGAGDAETFEVDLPEGRWRVGGGGDEPDAIVEVASGGAAELEWRRGDGARKLVARPGTVAVRLDNPTGGRVRVQLSGDPDGGRWLSAAWLTSMPEYRRQFGAQALAPDVRLGVRAVAVLFTDLTGSAAMYHTHGDALSFRLVHDHFAVLEAVLDQWGGARVKTIGDALMAVFVDPADAVSAAIGMQVDFAAWAAGLDMDAPPGLKVGLHFGPAMAVHTDQAGLDYFGGTVNLAARCEGQARRGDVVWTEAIQDAPGVAARVAAWGGAVEGFDADVKGLPERVRLYRAPAGAGSQDA